MYLCPPNIPKCPTNACPRVPEIICVRRFQKVVMKMERLLYFEKMYPSIPRRYSGEIWEHLESKFWSKNIMIWPKMVIFSGPKIFKSGSAVRPHRVLSNEVSYDPNLKRCGWYPKLYKISSNSVRPPPVYALGTPLTKNTLVPLTSSFQYMRNSKILPITFRSLINGGLRISGEVGNFLQSQ